MNILALLILAAGLAALLVYVRMARERVDPGVAAAARKRADQRAALRKMTEPAQARPVAVDWNPTAGAAFDVVEITDVPLGHGPLTQKEIDIIDAILKTQIEVSPRSVWGVAK